MKWLFKIPIIGDMVMFPFYICFRIFLPIGLYLSGCRRMKYGTLILWIPKEKKQDILDGLELLEKCDPDVFLRLTGKRHLFIYYGRNVKGPTNAHGYISGLNERYIKLGVQGIATFFVQCLFLSEASPSINQAKPNIRRHEAMRKVMNWMTEHLFHPGLINSYKVVVEKWEEKY